MVNITVCTGSGLRTEVASGHYTDSCQQVNTSSTFFITELEKAKKQQQQKRLLSEKSCFTLYRPFPKRSERFSRKINNVYLRFDYDSYADASLVDERGLFFRGVNFLRKNIAITTWCLTSTETITLIRIGSD